jgi:hypothetical protein
MYTYTYMYTHTHMRRVHEQKEQRRLVQSVLLSHVSVRLQACMQEWSRAVRYLKRLRGLAGDFTNKMHRKLLAKAWLGFGKRCDVCLCRCVNMCDDIHVHELCVVLLKYKDHDTYMHTHIHTYIHTYAHRVKDDTRLHKLQASLTLRLMSHSLSSCFLLWRSACESHRRTSKRYVDCVSVGVSQMFFKVITCAGLYPKCAYKAVCV